MNHLTNYDSLEFAVLANSSISFHERNSFLSTGIMTKQINRMVGGQMGGLIVNLRNSEINMLMEDDDPN